MPDILVEKKNKTPLFVNIYKSFRSPPYHSQQPRAQRISQPEVQGACTVYTTTRIETTTAAITHGAVVSDRRLWIALWTLLRLGTEI